MKIDRAFVTCAVFVLQSNYKIAPITDDHGEVAYFNGVMAAGDVAKNNAFVKAGWPYQIVEFTELMR